MLKAYRAATTTTLLTALVLLAANPLATAEEAESAAPAKKIELPGLGDPGALQSLQFELGPNAEGGLVLYGQDSRVQLVVSGVHATGQFRDWTRQVTYSVQPAGIIAVDSSGLVSPLADGEATVTAEASGGIKASVPIRVQEMANPRPINFSNQVVPVFTKLGCNAGGCHGKSGGKNGFALSLLGFYPDEDYDYLVKEARGRRLFPAAPDRSLLLLKATNTMAHGGGQRMQRDSYEYEILWRWIAQGMPYGSADDPTVERIEMVPAARQMPLGGSQQVRVLAHLTDGTIHDVTRIAQYEPNDTEMAEVTVAGEVKTLDLTGDMAIMARYQGQVAVFRATIPMGLKVDQFPQPGNFIDEIVFKKLRDLGIPPSEVCDDSTFIRRVTVDLTGKLPTLEETQAFLADSDPQKREKLVDRLLTSTDYADYFANKWSAVLRNKRQQPQHTRGTYAFHAWIRDAIYQNMPYDQFVRSIIAASGEVSEHPPVVWYRSVNQIHEQVEDTAQLFLGLRIQCARCHHHPFERWSQSDYFGFQAFFSRVGRKNGVNGLNANDEPRIYHNRGVAQAQNPRDGQQLPPTGLGGAPLELSPDEDPRHKLVDWMAAPDNPFFAPALVNRYWKHMFNRGLVDPEDDMRVTNPASNPELLDRMAKHFIDSGFDMRNLLRTIATSKTYQLRSEPNDYNVNDKQNFSRYYPKRLNAEVLLDAINQVTNNRENFNGLPVGMRAVQLPDPAVNNYFLTVFGKPQGDSACECERSSEANLAQSLHLLNSSEIQNKLSNGNSRAALLAKDQERPVEERIRELYLWAYSRVPSAEELEIATAHVAKTENKQQAFEDILWALINTKEFLFNH